MDGRVLTTLPKHGQSTRQPGAELPPGPTSQWELFKAHLNGTGGIQTGPSVGMQGWARGPPLSRPTTTCSNPCGLTEHGVQ